MAKTIVEDENDGTKQRIKQELKRLDESEQKVRQMQRDILGLYNIAMGILNDKGIDLKQAEIVYEQARKYKALDVMLQIFDMERRMLQKVYENSDLISLGSISLEVKA